MTSLAAQLQAVASAVPREEKLKGKASLLYELREAADIDLATIYAVGVQGFTELCRMDARFEVFQKPLFSRGASETNRELQDKAFNDRLNGALEGFLRLVSGRFVTPAAAKCLEYLIRRFKIHVYNVEAAVTCALPYHATPEFVKLVQLANLEGTSFYWLKGVKEKGAAPPRDGLVARCARDGAFLSFVCEAAAASAGAKGSPGAASAFYAVLLAEALAAMPRVTSQAVPRLLPYLEAGLAPAASAEQYAGALMVATQLASRAPLAPPLTEALLEGVAKGARVPLHAQALQASLALCQTQAVKTLPGRAFKHLVKLPDLPGHFADLCRGYRADALAVPLVVALAQSAATHANYERVLAGVVDTAPLSDAAVAALARALVAAAQSSTAAHDIAQRALRSLETRFPAASSVAVDAILSESAAKASSSAEAERAARAAAEFLRLTLAGSAAGPMPGHAASIGAALDHPSAGLREAALRELRKGGKSGALTGGALSGALLRRVADDHPRVAAAAASLPGLRVAVDDDDALFNAASERLASASAACSGKHADAESERAVAKRCVALACAALAVPFDEGETGETGESSGSDESESDSEEEKIGSGARVGALAGRGAALAFGHLTFSPSTRAVARAAIAAARQNRHPALSGLRGKRFKGAMERANAPGAKAPKEKKTKLKKSKAGVPDPSDARGGKIAVDKETRALMDTAANRAVVEALAEGLASDPRSWGEKGALTLWARDAWRVGSPRARATLLLALRRAAEGSFGDDSISGPRKKSVNRDDAAVSCATPSGVVAARRAMWTLVKDEWFGEHGGGAFLDADAPFETPGASGDGVGARVSAFELDALSSIKTSTFRAVAKHDTRVVAALARSAARAVCSFGAGNAHEAENEARSADGADAFDPAAAAREAFVVAAASLARSDAACATRQSLEAIVERILQALGEDAPAFLAARAACDPVADENENGAYPQVPRVALDLLASRGGIDASKDASTLAALVAACCASDPATRAAAARAIAALAPAAAKKKKPSAKASPSAGSADLSAVWVALAAAGDVVGDALGTSAASAHAATSEALAEGLKGDKEGAATRALLAPAVAFSADETLAGENIGKSGSVPWRGLSARGAARLVAAMRGAGSDAVKAEALAPALERALATAASDDSAAAETARASDLAGLAAEILATYTPACAKEGIGAHAWRAFVKAVVAHGIDAAPAPVRVAATARLTRDFVGALSAERRRWALRALFVAVSGDPDAGSRAAARDAVDALDLHAVDICALLDAATEAARGGSPARGDASAPRDEIGRAKKSKKPKPAGAAEHSAGGTEADADADAATGARAVYTAIAALEVFAWKPAVDPDGGVSVLVPACRAFLGASLDAAASRGEEARDETRGGDDDAAAARAAASGGYAQALVLSTLEALTRRAADTSMPRDAAAKVPKKSSKKSAVNADADAFWDVPLAVRAARDAEAGPARTAALSLLGALAAADPRGVMRRALEVSAALAHRASEPEAGSAPGSSSGAEDASSRRALEEALGAIVPAWIAGGLGVDAACERVVDALPEAPAHRRAGLCVAFLKATRGSKGNAGETQRGDGGGGGDASSANPGLAVITASLLTRAEALEAAAEASAARRAAKAARRAAKEGGAAAAAALEAIEMEKARAIETASAWAGDLVATLLARETATAAVHALARVAERAAHSEEGVCGRLACLVAETAARHLSSRAFVAAARREAASSARAAASRALSADERSEDQAAESRETRANQAAAAAAATVARTLQVGYAKLAENALVTLRAAAGAARHSGPSSEGNAERASAQAERAGRRVLAALDGLLAPGAYLRAIAPLLENDDARVRHKALRLIAHRLRAAAAAEAARARGAGKAQSRRARSRARAQAHRQASRERRKTSRQGSGDASLDGNDDADGLEEEGMDEVSAAASLMPRLASLAGADAGASARAAALGALEAAAARFGDAFSVAGEKKNAASAASAASPAAAEESSRRREAREAFAAPLLATVPAMVDALGAPARAVAAAAANAMAAVVRALGPRALPALPAAVPALFAAARAAAATLSRALKDDAVGSGGDDGDDDEQTITVKNDEGHVLVACLRAVTALMDRLGGFLSPHLGDVLALLLSPSLVSGHAGGTKRTPEASDAAMVEAEEGDTRSAATIAAVHAAALREALPRNAPPRLLLDPLSDAMRAALGDVESEDAARVSAAAAAAALRMAASCVAAKPPAPAHRDALVSMLLRALDVRRTHPPSFDDAAVDAVEGAAAEAFVTAASSLTESAFAPALATATEWAKARASDPEAARARLSALFRVASALSDALRGVFTPLATPILDLAAAALDPAADVVAAPTAAKRRRKETTRGATDRPALDAFRAECEAWRTRARALGTVRRICTHDSGEIIDASRFNQLHPLVSSCLSAKPPSAGGKARDVSSFPTPADLVDLHDDSALAPGGVGAEAAACVAALIAAAPDDTLWKPAHRGTLLATRDASPRARRVAVAALAATTAKLEEEFLTLLPESIPYLSELFEDPDEEVEGAARDLTATLAELSGEDLKSLMATGGE